MGTSLGAVSTSLSPSNSHLLPVRSLSSCSVALACLCVLTYALFLTVLLTPNLRQCSSAAVEILVSVSIYTGCVSDPFQLRRSGSLRKKCVGLLFLLDVRCTTCQFITEQVVQDGIHYFTATPTTTAVHTTFRGDPKLPKTG